MANVTVNTNVSNINVSTTYSNITVSDDGVIVSNITVIDNNIAVGTTENIINVAEVAAVSDADVRAALGNTAPILYNVSTGIFSFDSNAAFSGKTTDDLAEGTTNLYFTNTRVDNRVPTSILNGNITLKKYQDTVYDNGNISGNVSIDVANGAMHKANITGNITGISIPNLAVGTSLLLVLEQDAIGLAYLDTTTFASNWTNWKFVNNDTALNAAPNGISYLGIVYDGEFYHLSVLTNAAGDLIPNSQLANSNVIINGITIPLGSSATLTTANIAENTNLYFTAARVRSNISASDAGGLGSFSYSNTTGVFTYTGPADSDIRNLLSGTSPITYNSGTGAIGLSGTANITTTGNISGGFILGNGSLLTGLPATYSNASVANFLANGYGSNNITTTGTITAGTLSSTTLTSGTANVTVASGKNLRLSGTSPTIIGDESVASQNATIRFDSVNVVIGDDATTDRFAIKQKTTGNVLFQVGSYQGGSGSSSPDADVRVFGNIWIGLEDPLPDNSNAYIKKDGEIYGRIVNTLNDITAGGNISAPSGYFLGNGRFLTGIVASSAYGNANVANFLVNGYGSNNITTTGTITAGALAGDGSGITGLLTTYVNEGTNLYFTPARARGNISVAENLTYNSTTGVIGMANSLANVNSITTTTGTNFTINTDQRLILTDRIKGVTTNTGNINGNGYALFVGNGSPGAILAHSGTTELTAFAFLTGNTTSGSNVITGVSLVDVVDLVTPLSLSAVTQYYAWDYNLGLSQSFPFPPGTYVQSVDAGNSTITMSQAAAATTDLDQDILLPQNIVPGMWPGAFDANTGLLLGLITPYSGAGSGSKTTISDQAVMTAGKYGYPASGPTAADFVYSVDTVGNYSTTGTMNTNFLNARTQFEAPRTIMNFPRGLTVGDADLTNRAENDGLPSFGMNILWDGLSTSAEYGEGTPLTQLLIKNYTDNNLQADLRTNFGPRIFFTASEGNKNQSYVTTYPRKNLELGRIAWWSPSQQEPALGTGGPPAWISGVTGQDNLTNNSGVGMYFGISPNTNNFNRSLYLASSMGNTLIASAQDSTGSHRPIIFAPSYVGSSQGNSALLYNQTITGSDPNITTIQTSGAHFAQINYNNVSALTGAKVSVTNGNNSTTQREGNIVLSLDRNLTSANANVRVRTGGTNYNGSLNPDRVRFTFAPDGLVDGTAVTINNFTNATIAAALNGNVFYVKRNDAAGYVGFDLYYDSGLTSAVNLGVGNVQGGPGTFEYTRNNGVTAKEWSWVLPQSSNSLILAEDGVTRTTFSGGNITATAFYGDGGNLTNVSALGFTTFAVAGQSNVVADTAGDTMTLVAGSGMVITTDAATDTITFQSTGGYGNAEVATFLANYGSNTIVTTGNITAGNTIVNGVTFNASNIVPSTGQIRYNTDYGTFQTGLNGSNVMLMGQDLVVYAVNNEANTLSKGEVVFISGANGNHATVNRAINNSDNNSATTIGIVKSDIAAGQLGYIVSQGVVDGLNLGSYTAGDKLYLGNVAGTFTNVKPQSPEHYVFIGVVERANAGNGQVLVRVQNGFELDEIHDVNVNNVQPNDILFRNSGNTLWVNQNFGTTVTNSNITLKQFQETRVDLGSTGGNITLNMANGSIFAMTATSSISNIALSNAGVGASGTLIITQDGTGGKTLTTTSAWKFAGASKTLTTTANAIDIISFFTDGTTVYAALSKGYA
jgi:hypothetical protein